MKSLVLQLPDQAAQKFETLKQAHGDQFQELLEKIVSDVIERVGQTPNTELAMPAGGENAQGRKQKVAIEFATAANYVIDTNLELYRRLA